MKKIGMIVAMEKELSVFLEKQNVKLKKSNVSGFSVTEFKLGKNKVICVRSGMGEIFAAGATQLLITKYNVDVIVNFGVCGALVENLAVKNVVLVKGVVHYDFDTSAIDNCEVGRYLQFPSVVIDTDKGLLNKALSIMPDLRQVICASADKFVADDLKKQDLNKTFGAEICEMESAGVLLTSINANKPCLIVKAVSDGIGGAEEYAKMVYEASRQYVALINKIAEII